MEVPMKRIAFVAALAAILAAAPAPARSAGSASDLHAMLLRLEERVVNLDFDEKPLDEVLRYFSDLTDVNLAVSPVLKAERSEEELRVTLSLHRISVKSALQIIVDLKSLGSVYRSGVIFLTTPKDARGKPRLRIYPIGDLTVRIRDFPAPDIRLHASGEEGAFDAMFPHEEEGQEHAFADPEFIMDLITQNTGDDTWDDDGVRYSVNERYLVIRQYPSVHREIEEVLDLLRAYR